MEGPPQAEPRIAVGAVVVDRAGRVLLVKRGRPPNAGAWTLPGGRVLPGESLSGAVVRELLEETALTVRVLGPLGAVHLAAEGFAYLIHEHLAVAVDDSPPRAGDDAADARWVARGDLVHLAVADEAIAVIDRGLAEAQRLGATQIA